MSIQDDTVAICDVYIPRRDASNVGGFAAVESELAVAPPLSADTGSVVGSLRDALVARNRVMLSLNAFANLLRHSAVQESSLNMLLATSMSNASGTGAGATAQALSVDESSLVAARKASCEVL